MAKGQNSPRPRGPAACCNRSSACGNRLAEAQKQLEQETVTASAGGGAIKVTMSGDQKCRTVEISPDLVRQLDAEMLQDLVLSAVNLALGQSRALAAERLGPLSGGMPS